jgi:hypothetical protein
MQKIMALLVGLHMADDVSKASRVDAMRTKTGTTCFCYSNVFFSQRHTGSRFGIQFFGWQHVAAFCIPFVMRLPSILLSQMDPDYAVPCNLLFLLMPFAV